MASFPRGFTLVELVTVMVLLSLISVYAVIRGVSSADVTLPSQAQMMASDIRHTQALAMSWGRSLRLAICAGSGGAYTVSDKSSAASACNQSAITDPATGSSFHITVQKGVALAGPSTLDFNSLGQPSAAASYILSSTGSAETIAVQALTGFVTVTP